MSYPLSFEGLVSTQGPQPFARRVLHPWMHLGVVPIPDPERIYPALLARTSAPRLAYLHIPFCSNHCLFCGFYRNKSNEAAMTRYVDALIAEIEQDAAREGMAGRPVEAVFLGGGTPSALSARDLQRLLLALRTYLSLSDDCEITVEGRVAGFDAEKVSACVEAGANRFSIGIQSFDTRLRQRMGRKANREEAVNFLSGLVARQDAAVVCDLIYGLPGQTDEIWRKDVALCNEIGLDGVDLYCLSLQAGSPLALSIEKGALPPAATDAEAQVRYCEGGEILEAAGWRRLSQAHWGRSGRERNRYNNATKAGADCLAFGAGAGGMLAGHRFMLDAAVDSFETRVRAAGKPISGLLVPAPHQRACNAVMQAMEEGCLTFTVLETLVAPGFVTALAPLLQHWAQQELMVLGADSLTLTACGRYWHNNIAATLFSQISLYLDGPQAARASRPSHGGHPAGIPMRPAQAMPSSSSSSSKPEHPHEHHHHS
jgi:putative heme utilization radical SAM enzyme HutW